jgi:dihydroxyacetone kinase-like protein
VGRVTVGYDEALGWIRSFAAEVAANRQQLTKLDSAIGDGDHGINMDRGMQAALEKASALDGSDIGRLFKTVGMTRVSKVGGAGGPLYGTFFMQLGSGLAGKSEMSAQDWGAALEAGIKGVQARGKAEPGDKTMIDALGPALRALQESLASDSSLAEALERSARAAEEGMKATVPLVARKGRASYLGERSAGHQDPGATSSYLLLRTAADAWGKEAA